MGRRLLFKQVSLNDKWQERFTIFRDIRSISLHFHFISSLLILRMTKESHRLRYLFCELSNITLFIIMLVLYLYIYTYIYVFHQSLRCRKHMPRCGQTGNPPICCPRGVEQWFWPGFRAKLLLFIGKLFYAAITIYH